MKDLKVAVVGLGYVGLPLAVEFGKKRTVVGFDINQGRIAELRQGIDSTLEVDAAELKEASELSFTSNLQDLQKCNVFIVTVPTPIDEHKQPDLTPLVKASESIGKVLKKGDIVIYESTVYPGATEEDCVVCAVDGGVSCILQFGECFFWPGCESCLGGRGLFGGNDCS